MPIQLDTAQRDSLMQLRGRFWNEFHSDIVDPVNKAVRGAGSASEDIGSITRELTQLQECGKQPGRYGLIAVEDTLLPLVKLIIIDQRRKVAETVDESLEKTQNPEVRSRLEEALAVFDEWISQDWFEDTATRRMPRLTDLLSLEEAEKVLFRYHNLEYVQREYDEKFHTLLSPSLFLRDLEYFRQTCGLRGRSVAVAFVDIDDFKAFNTKYSESVVDVNLLPAFMETMEAHVYGRGHAYRAGGEEYLVLLPNATEADTVRLLDDLRKRVKTVEYRGISESTSVSIGVCVADADSLLTNREMRTRANEAEKFAKENGKDCVASYRSDLYRSEDRYVAAGGDNTSEQE